MQAINQFGNQVQSLPGFGYVSDYYNDQMAEHFSRDPFYEKVPKEGKKGEYDQIRRRPPQYITEEQRVLWKKIMKRAWYHDRNFCGCTPIDCGCGMVTIISSIPILGSIIAYKMHYKMIKMCHQAGCPPKILAAMGGNATLDFTMTLIPLLGVLLSWMKASSTRNAGLFDDWLRGESEKHRQLLLKQKKQHEMLNQPPKAAPQKYDVHQSAPPRQTQQQSKPTVSAPPRTQTAQQRTQVPSSGSTAAESPRSQQQGPKEAPGAPTRVQQRPQPQQRAPVPQMGPPGTRSTPVSVQITAAPPNIPPNATATPTSLPTQRSAPQQSQTSNAPPIPKAVPVDPRQPPKRKPVASPPPAVPQHTRLPPPAGTYTQPPPAGTYTQPTRTYYNVQQGNQPLYQPAYHPHYQPQYQQYNQYQYQPKYQPQAQPPHQPDYHQYRQAPSKAQYYSTYQA